MKVKYRLIIAFVLCVIIWKTVNVFYLSTPKKTESVISTLDEGRLSEKVKVSVYYEALCSDSRFFILKQLVPAYESIPDYIELDFVPYGKAEVSEYIFNVTKINYKSCFRLTRKMERLHLSANIQR